MAVERLVRTVFLTWCAVWLSARSLHAQACGRFWQTLEIRQDIDTKDNVAKSALAQVRLPTRSSDTATVLVDVGVLTALCSGAHSTVNLAADYHRNTAQDAPQDVWRAGVTFDVTPGSEGTTPYFEGRAMLKQNRLKGTTSIDAALLASLTGNGGSYLPNTYVPLGSRLTLVYTPYVGLELDREVASNTSDSTFLRLVAQFDAQLLLGQRSQPTVELTLTNAYRRDLRDATLPNTRIYGEHSAGIDWYFARGKRALAGVGLSYVHGTDPSQELFRASYFELGLRVRVRP